MTNHDRVSDLYYGRLDRGKTQESCRDRVHWLCGQVRGERVLDVGCSQGVVSIILGREGHCVVGADIEAEAIATARRALEAEPDLVRQRVTFQQADVFQADFDRDSFDTIVFGEILEHLVHPDVLLDRACEWLCDEGRVVVSVPLGYHPYHDHKQTFYLSELLELLSRRFSVQDVNVLHQRFFCAAAVKPRGVERPHPPAAEQLAAWRKECNLALEEIQRRHFEAQENAKRQRESLTAQLNDLREQARRLEEGNKALEARLAESQAQREKLLKEGRAKERELSAHHKRELELLKLRHQETKRTLETQLLEEQTAHRRAKDRTAALREQLADVQRTLEICLNEVRYRLGDALVRALTPSRDTLLLPFRIIKLFSEGIRKRRARNVSERSHHRRSAGETLSTDIGVPSVRPLPEWLADMKPADGLEEPFSDVARELIVRPELRIAGIMDEFSWRAWQYEADLYTFTPRTWREVLERKPPHLLLVESTWKGLDDAWHFQVRDLGKRPDVVQHYALPDVVKWCRERGIPTVFYNKEDPPNFEYFIDSARLFDVVFTSDANCIADYRERIAHERVYALPFAAQPRVHNPISSGEREGNVCFAGTWYNHRHEQRQSDAEAILKPALAFGLHIFDRMADSPSRNYRWPEVYQPSVHGALPYAKMVAAYKRFKVFLNINSVANSPTMFARRVFELLASGTPVVSSESRGIREILGEEAVPMSGSEEKTREILRRLLDDEEFRARLALRGQRKVLSEHTYTHRLDAILKAAGIESRPIGRPRVTVIAAVENERDVEAINDNFGRQAYENAGLVLCTKQASPAERFQRACNGSVNARVICRPGTAWGALLAEAMDACANGRVAAMSPCDYYGPHYLTDYANATLYLDERTAIGKNRTYFCQTGDAPQAPADGAEYQFVDALAAGTVCLPAVAARAIAEQLGECDSVMDWWERAARSMERRYAADRFNYVRRARPSEGRDLTKRLRIQSGQETTELAAAVA